VLGFLVAGRQARVYTRTMDTLCYCAAVRAAARKTTTLYDAALAPAGLNVAQFGLMRRIERAGTVSLTELGRMSELDRSTIGRNVKVLERLGLVSFVSANDQREAPVRLTPAGAAALGKATPLWDGAQRKVETALGVAAAEHLRAMTQQL
jgi:DNA-binding MarR family transcriptional regulator